MTDNAGNRFNSVDAYSVLEQFTDYFEAKYIVLRLFIALNVLVGNMIFEVYLRVEFHTGIIGFFGRSTNLLIARFVPKQFEE